MTIEYFDVLANAGPDFGVCCSAPGQTSPKATLPNIAIGSSLSGGLPVTSGGPNPVKMVSPTGQILWWTPSRTNGITYEGTATVTLPFADNSLFAPLGNGTNDTTKYQTAILSGTIMGTGSDVKVTVTSDDDALVYVNGKYVGGILGVEPARTVTLDLGVVKGNEALEVFYADREHTQAVLDLGVSGATVSAVPEPSTWAMLMLGFAGIGFVAYRRQRNVTGARLA
jgi:hypothetical protein